MDKKILSFEEYAANKNLANTDKLAEDEIEIKVDGEYEIEVEKEDEDEKEAETEETEEKVEEAEEVDEDFEKKFNSAMDSVDDVRTEIEMTLEDTPQLKSFYTVDAQLDKALGSYRKKIKRILSAVSESTNEAEETEEVAKAVSEMMTEAYESAVKEACEYDKDDYPDHTVESYLKENATLAATLVAQSAEDANAEIHGEGLTKEMYEACLNGIKEAYNKKIDELKEMYEAK
jgi:membrane-associated HD superfamily phosphohydrolase